MDNKNTTCPHCGFYFKALKPAKGLQACPCGKSYADISKDFIRILFEEEN